MRAVVVGAALSAIMATQAIAGNMMVGGYAVADTKQPEIIKAAQFAVVTKNAQPDSKPVKLVKIRKAEQQVVAGMNYRLCLSVKDKRHAYRAFVVVYAELSGQLNLTEWKPNGC